MCKKEVRQTAEICFLKSRFESNITPRFRAESVGQSAKLWKWTEESITFDLCCRFPIRRYSVLEGFTDNLFAQNHEYIWSNVADSVWSDDEASLPENDIYRAGCHRHRSEIVWMHLLDGDWVVWYIMWKARGQVQSPAARHILKEVRMNVLLFFSNKDRLRTICYIRRKQWKRRLRNTEARVESF